MSEEMFFQVAEQIRDLKQRLQRLETTDPQGAWFFIDEALPAAPVASITLPAVGTIPAFYRTLVLVGSVRSARAAINDSLLLRFNGDAGANYDFQWQNATAAGVVNAGGAAAATTIFVAQVDAANARAANFSPFRTYIHYYSSTTPETQLEGHSSTLGDRALANMIGYQHAGGWRNTAIVTSITLLSTVAANIVANSRVTLYGIY